MELTETVRVRTNCVRDYKACAGELGCKRPVLPTYGLCRVHADRRQHYGTTTAQHPLRARSRTPYIQAAFSWLKDRLLKRDDITVLQTIVEFDSFIRLRCEYQHVHDLSRRHIGSHRKMQGILANILKRWPDGHQAAVAVLSVILGTRLACAHEPGVTRHPAFTRAMQVNAVYSLVRRKNIRAPFTMPRPVISGRWLAKRLDDAVSPFIRFMCASTKDRDKAILAKVIKHRYTQNVRWETLNIQTISRPDRKRTRKGHPCKWKGQSAPRKSAQPRVCPWKGQPRPKKGTRYVTRIR